MGWIGWTVKHDPIQRETFIYLAEVMVHPEFRKKEIATKLATEAEKNARETGLGHFYCYIFEPNDASTALSEKLGYSNKGEFKPCAISAYKKTNIAQKFKIERINKNDIPDVVSLINDYLLGVHTLYPTLPKALNLMWKEFPHTD